jgi:hypothetical protein
MSLITYIAVGLLLLGGLVLFVAFRCDYNLPDTDWGFGLFILSVVLFVCSLCTFGVWGISNLDYRTSSNECEQFSDQTGLETKMVRYNTMSYECLVRADSGWVTKGNYWNSEVGS